MIKEIGSTFWLTQKEYHKALQKKQVPYPNIRNLSGSFISSCRSGIRLAIQDCSIKNKVALVPAFTCESVLVPFQKEGFQVFPYPITQHLNIDVDNFISCVKRINPSIILIHRYFGFNTFTKAIEIVRYLQEKGIIVIEDLTQTMFSSYELPKCDYRVGSIRKWLPIPDGAFVSMDVKNLSEDYDLVVAKTKALIRKGQYMEHQIGDRSLFMNDFKEAECLLDSREKVYAMSKLSLSIFNDTDIEGMKQRRWDNYKYLAKGLSRFSDLEVIFPIITEDITPFQLPVLVKKNRKEFQQYLVKNQIFATIIWGCPKEFENLIDENVKFIYNHIICFHCDQRYDLQDMKRIECVVKDFYNSKS